MGVLDFFKSASKSQKNDAQTTAKIKEIIDICDPEQCSGGCTDSNTLDKDEHVFANLKIEHETPLFGSSRSSKIHFVVPTSQSDWAHDACMEKKNSVQYNIQSWISKNADQFTNIDSPGESLLCSVSSLPIDLLDIQVMKGTKNDVLIFPHFLRLKAVRSETVNDVLQEIVPLLLHNNREALLAKDYIQEITDDSFVFLCSHRTRDKRCGVTAPILEKHFNKNFQRHGIYRDNSDFRPHGARVAFVNHVGGHKFAANVIIYLKKSAKLVWLGRVTPVHVEAIVDCLVVPDEPKLPFPEMVRCVQQYQF